MMEADAGIWRRLVERARLAPSPHNTQPWKVRAVSGSEAELLMVRSRMLPDEDTTGRFLICAMGIFIEAMSIVAAAEGWRLGVEDIELDLQRELIPFASLMLTRDETVRPTHNPALLEVRRTSRLEPQPRMAEAAALEAAGEAAAGGGLRLETRDDPALIEAVLDRNIDAVFHDLNVGPYRREIAGWFRCTHGAAQRKRDGLDARCMGMPGYELYLSTAAPWLMKARVMRALYHRRLGGATQLGFLAGPFFESRGAAQAAGRCLLRVWLVLASHGVAIHPFGNLVTNGEAHRWVSGVLGCEDIWLIFRLGYTATPPRSLRLETGDLLC